MNELILQMKNIEKSFPGVHALKNAYFDLKAGEVHALMGENGAGKSTLMKVLCGIHKRDGGEITLFGNPVNFHNIAQAQKAGISIIHQELNMIGDLTVAQNIFIGREPIKNGIYIDDRKMEKEPLFLTCIKRSGSFVIVMKYQTDKVSSEDGIVNLFVGFSC